MKLNSTPLSLIALSLVAAACAEPATSDPSVSSVAVETETVSAALSVLDRRGRPIDCNEKNTQVVVETRQAGGRWQRNRDVKVDFRGPSRLDVMIVADNSGSQEEELTLLQESIAQFARQMLNRSQGDRVGLVRVSTDAQVFSELTEQSEQLEAATDSLFITNGWTAFWDGIRLANDTLEEAASSPEEVDGKRDLCVDRSYRAIIGFTDGRDNNSADQHETSYAGDGIDTTAEQLKSLSVNGVPTPVHLVGIGAEVEAETLSDIALASGGRYEPVENMGRLVGALRSTAARLGSQIPICFKRPSCEHTEARVMVTVNGEQTELPLALPHSDCQR